MGLVEDMDHRYPQAGRVTDHEVDLGSTCYLADPVDPPGLFRTKITFTDDNGLRWQRIDRQQPDRILSAYPDPQADHDRPIRKLGG